MESKHPILRWIHGTGCDPFEYYCSDCGELHLSYIETDRCANCGSDKITKGKLGTLSKGSDDGLEGQNEGMGRG